jgi:DNA-binding PadR family transcriptional regulator
VVRLQEVVGGRQASSPRGGRPRRYYRPTPAGIRTLREFREMWVRVWDGVELPDPEATA